MSNTLVNMYNAKIPNSYVRVMNMTMVLAFSIVPLLLKYPFNINIFLAWEGAYRLSIGQIPYVDFYLPMGFLFWVLPAIFFKLFGPNLFTLVIVQCFINLATFLSFWYLLKLLRVNIKIIFIASLVLGLSYVLLNFWPWYNNFAFVTQLFSILFFLKFRQDKSDGGKWNYLYLILSAGFSAMTFFTKQDAGGLAIMLNLALVLYAAWYDKSYLQVIIFLFSLLVWFAIFIGPFVSHDFFYWFNIGQSPHYSRIDFFTYASQIFGFSNWLKFYFLIIVLIVLIKFQNIIMLLKNERDGILLILTLGILFQASVIQVTSYIPHYAYFYVHGFVFAYFLFQIDVLVQLKKLGPFVIITLLTAFIWSSDTWKYGLRIAQKVLPASYFEVSNDVVSKKSWLNPTETIFDDRSTWQLSTLKSFDRIYLPPGTILGMNRLIERYKGRKDLKVLNMTELTPLAVEIGFEPIVNQPLWFHKNVSIFDREIAEICYKIQTHEYDLVLFESIPVLNNFYPQEVYDCLMVHYRITDEFRAPRRETNAHITVFE